MVLESLVYPAFCSLVPSNSYRLDSLSLVYKMGMMRTSHSQTMDTLQCASLSKVVSG